MTIASIAGTGTALPPAVPQRLLWAAFFDEHYAGSARARALFERSGVVQRGGCVVPMEEDVRGWGTERRMRRFVEEAVPLGRRAVESCLADAGLQPEDVDLFTVVSCTGYATPGVDLLIAAELGMAPGVERLHIGHMGCYAAIPALATVADAAVARGRTGVLLCVELPSLHLQPPAGDVEQMVAHALFADGAAAVAVVPGAARLDLVDVVAHTDASRRDAMTWDVTDRGFRMGLSPSVPRALRRHVQASVDRLLAPHGLGRADVAGWAVHPGGPKVLDVVGDELDLDGELAASRSVLACHGNVSSPTVLIVLSQLLGSGTLGPGDHVVCMAFGPGLTLYAALLRVPGGRAA